MLDLALIRAEPARIKAALARRGVGPAAVDAVTDADGRRTERQEVCEVLRFRRRRISEEVARAKAGGGETADLEELGRAVGDQLRAVEAEIADLEARRQEAILALPNLPTTDVPDAAPEPAARLSAETAAKAEAAGYSVPAPASPRWPKPFAPLPHWDLMQLLDLAAPPETPGLGRRFLIWRGRGARLVRALLGFMLDLHAREFGYEEVRAPALASRAALTGSAHLPLLEDKMYALHEPAAEAAGDPPRDEHGLPASRAARAGDLFLAPRAEPHLANLYAGQTLEGTALPVRLVAAGPAFRREAAPGGAAGRGLLRLHEFDTVELFAFCRPDQGESELEHAVAAAEAVLARLDVPHRRRLRPAPQLSHAAAKTVDLEVWAPGMPTEAKGEGRASGDKGGGALEFPSTLDPRPSTPDARPSPLAVGARGRWLAVAAVSSFTDYQARRTNTRYRDERGQAHLVHTVGGAAVALPRLVAAILENGQESDGSVRLPAALAQRVGEEVLRA